MFQINNTIVYEPMDLTNFSTISISECFSRIEQKLCENIDEEYNFQCDFPRDISALNTLESLSTMDIIQLVVTVIVFCVSVIGNSAVLIIISSKRSLRTAMDLFLVNLSIADLLISIVCLIDNLLRSLSYSYLLGSIGCKAGSFVHMICLFASVLTLVGIAIDRVYAVLFPLKTLQSSVRLRPFLVGLIWIAAAGLASPFFVLKEYRVYQWLDFREAQCTYTRGRGFYNQDAIVPFKRCTHGYNYTYFYHFMVTMLMFFIPVLVMVIAYGLIVSRLWKSRVIGELSAETQTRRNTKKRIVRLALVVLSAFLLCWAPLQILIIVSLTGHFENREITGYRMEFWIYLLAYSNSALNPIIYGGFNKTYRQEFFSLFGPKRHSQMSISNGGTHRGLDSVPRNSYYPRPNHTNTTRTSFIVNLPIRPFVQGTRMEFDRNIGYQSHGLEEAPDVSVEDRFS